MPIFDVPVTQLPASDIPTPVRTQGGTEYATGVEILQAAGTNAKNLMATAYDQVMLLIAAQTRVNKNLIDLARVMPPYNLTYNPDGSLDSATPI